MLQTRRLVFNRLWKGKHNHTNNIGFFLNTEGYWIKFNFLKLYQPEKWYCYSERICFFNGDLKVNEREFPAETSTIWFPCRFTAWTKLHIHALTCTRACCLVPSVASVVEYSGRGCCERRIYSTQDRIVLCWCKERVWGSSQESAIMSPTILSLCVYKSFYVCS